MLPFFLCDRFVTGFPVSPYSPFFKVNNLCAFAILSYALKGCSLAQLYGMGVAIHHPNIRVAKYVFDR
jgi:hypothetical protein